MGKGTDRERNLVYVLEDRLYRAFRAGASGGGTTKYRPDVIAGRDDIGRLLGVEVKARSDDNLYIRKEEMVQILCRGPDGLDILPDDVVNEHTTGDVIEQEGFGCEAWFAVFWPHNKAFDYSFVFLTLEQIINEMGDSETGKSYRIEKERALKIGHHREEFTLTEDPTSEVNS